MPFNPLSDLLKRHIRKKGLAYQVEAALVLETCNQIALEIWGSSVKSMMRPLYVKDQVLTIAVLAPALAQEIKMREKEIIERINAKIGGEAVISLRFLA